MNSGDFLPIFMPFHYFQPVLREFGKVPVFFKTEINFPCIDIYQVAPKYLNHTTK